MGKMSKFRITWMMTVVLFAVAGAGCGYGSRDTVEDTVVWEVPDTVYRPWDEVKDDDYYKIAEDKRFNIEYADGSILIFGVNEDGESVNVFGGNPNGVEKLVITSNLQLFPKFLGGMREFR